MDGHRMTNDDLYDFTMHGSLICFFGLLIFYIQMLLYGIGLDPDTLVTFHNKNRG